MMKQMQQSVCALTVLVATTLPALAESVDVRVIGTIAPAACTPTVSGGGTIDYGIIDGSTLSATEYTVLPLKEIDFSISCTAPAKVAIKGINGRPNSLAGGVEGSASHSGGTPVLLPGLGGVANVVGLGLDGTTKIGGYGIVFVPDSFTDNGTTVSFISQLGNPMITPAWTTYAAGSLYHAGTVERYTSWAESGKTVPVAIENLAGKMKVQAYLNKGSELDLTRPITLDGLSTLEVVYL